jgi:N4-gp56 family major capsid protein
MATNTASTFGADISQYIADKTLPLARRQLVVYQFGDPATLPKGNGTTYTATRFQRVPLPFQPLSEGVPPVGQQMTIQQVSAQCQQWGDKITITDIAEMTPKHPIFQEASNLIGLQSAETLERNTFNNLLAGSQVNYVNSRGSRANLAAGDVLNPHELNRASAMLFNLGTPRFMGDEVTDMKLDVGAGQPKASSSPRAMPHYAGVFHPFVVSDMRENSVVVTAWSYSDINRLYNFELGELDGVRCCMSNMVPTFTGVAAVTGTAVAGGGTFASGNYTTTITGSDIQNQYESRIYQTSGNITVAANGSISVTLPSTTGFTYSVYVSATGGSSPQQLGLCSAGPTSGPLAGMAVQLPAGSTVIITGPGIYALPPAAPATNVTVYPTFVFGRGAYAQVKLDGIQTTFLKEADKSDPLNQLRVVGWKTMYGTLIKNQNFFMRIESSSAFNSTFG